MGRARPVSPTQNGHIEAQINKRSIEPAVRAADRNCSGIAAPMAVFFCGMCRPAQVVSALAGRRPGVEPCTRDLDGGGDLDLSSLQINGPALVLRNDTASGIPWLRVRLAAAARSSRMRSGQGRVTANGSTQRGGDARRGYLVAGRIAALTLRSRPNRGGGAPGVGGGGRLKVH